MILSKNSVGSRKKGLYSNSRVLRSTTDTSALTQWVLTNDRVTFTFIEDQVTGVRLDSWRCSDFTETVYNKSRNLWCMNMMRDYATAETRTLLNFYTLYPSASNFSAPSLVPEITSEYKRFIFNWYNVKYDQKLTRATCNVTVTATLYNDKDCLDIKISIAANQGYTSENLTNFASCTVNSIGFPSISIKKSDTESHNDNYILSAPIWLGYTYRNPFKYLRSPRFTQESYQYSNTATRAYASGQAGDPGPSSLYRYVYGSPGGLTIPALVFGRTDTKEGTLLYMMDQEGTNPKAFYWYFDDSGMHIDVSHVSDHMVDPYGVGGYDNPSLGYSVDNTPTVSIRIKPFKSESRWIDWKGFEIYRDQAVPEQEEYGWLPKSFYDRYIEGSITKRAAEVPMILNVNGYTTGDNSNLTNSVNFYSELYRNSISPVIEDEPLIPMHYQPLTLNAFPNSTTGASNPLAAYWGWEGWAASGTGVSFTGPDPYRSPDFDEFNIKHQVGFTGTLAVGGLQYLYLTFAYLISTGSRWTQTYSGIDLCQKSLGDEYRRVTNDEYAAFARTPQAATIYSQTYNACPAVDINKEHFIDIGEAFGAQGVNAYHDTLGAFGRGCFAKDHKHYDPVAKTLVTTTHPRGSFTNYFNKKQVEWLASWNSGGQATFQDNHGLDPSEWQISQAAEMRCDTLLNNVPVAIIGDGLGPLYAATVTEVGNPRPDAIQTSYAGVVFDRLNDTDAQALLALTNTTLLTADVSAPNWIQRCPAFQIALSDRAIENEFNAIYASNAYPSFFNIGVRTGYGTYGQILYRTGVEEDQSMDWAAFAVMGWPMSNRMSVWHLDKQRAYVQNTGAYTSLENNEYIIMNSGIWSGHTENLVKKLLRIQAYNPDYIYHGRVTHPIESWTAPISNEPSFSRLLRKAKMPNLRSIGEVSGEGEEVIQHFVRRHRESDNLLIGLGSWYSGTASFSGMFDPEAYGIEQGYQVYSLDVNSQNHGTKTLIAVREAGESYSISQSFDEFDFTVYEIETNSTELDPDIFADIKTEYTPIRYSYDVLQLIYKDMDLAYSYGAVSSSQLDLPLEGYKASETQQILNNIPQWTKARQDQTSNAWKLVNSWGMNIESMLHGITEKVSNINLNTSSLDSLSTIYYSDISSKSLLDKRIGKNLLFNSSFSIKDMSRTKLPAGWKMFDGCDSSSLSFSSPAIATRSLSSSNGVIKIGQEVLLDNISIESITGSIYVLCPSGDVDIKLLIVLEKTDGTSISKIITHSTNNREWLRLILPISVNSTVYRAHFSVICNCEELVSISNPQLELGSVSDWANSVNDTVPYLKSYNRFNAVFAENISGSNIEPIPVFGIEDEDQFIDIGLPTRIEKITKPIKNILPISSKAYGRKVSQLGEIIRTEYEILEDQIVERSISPTVWDIFNRYDIKELRYFDEQVYGKKEISDLSITPLATCIRKDYLFVACKEEYKGSTYRTLKIVRPLTPPNGETYLECIVDFDLNLNFDNYYYSDSQSTSEEISRVAISEIDQNYLVITTSTNVNHYYRLHFDYYHFKPGKNRLYTIENYGPKNLTIL